MKISLDWLNSYLDRPAEAGEAQRVLTQIGLTVEAVEPRGGDSLLEVEVTSNRSDCLSHIGVARELAAATGRGLKEPAPAAHKAGPPVQTLTSIENGQPMLCPLYTARVITGVKVAPSPAWLAQRLESIGLRPVNNVVDVTNFVLHELGQPLHAFDMAKLSGRRIVVRSAARGEPFTAIDGSKHTLGADMLVIADGARPQAVAGIMGGADSEVTAATTDVLLESARFDPLNIRTTSRALKLSSDSSYRFERGVDPRGVDRASARAAALIVETAGGALAQGVLMAGQELPAPKIVQMRPERCSALLGIDLPVALMVQLLRALGLEPQLDGDFIACTIPSHRLDLHREVDLIEEISRLHGYDHIPMQDKMLIEVKRPQRSVQARQALARVLTAHGYCETITFSFMDPKLAVPFAQHVEVVTVDEEKKKAEPALRPSVLPSLLACRKSNQDAGNRQVRLFEVARAFGRREGQYVESRRLAMLADAEDSAQTMRAMRGTVQELLDAMGWAGRIKIRPCEPQPWTDHAAQVLAGDQVIGLYGPASPAMLKLFDLQSPVILADFNYESLIAAYPPQPRTAALPKFPAIERDLSVIVDEPVPWQTIDAIIARTRPALLEHVEFVTVYRGKPVPPGRKSVTFRMTFRDPNRTLKHDEVSEQVHAVVAAMTTELNAELRAG